MLSNNLKALRKKAGLSQMRFASEVGINRSTLADYETGSCYPKPDRLKKMASFFRVTVDQLISDAVGDPDSHITDGIKILAVTVDKNGRENIEFVPHTAQAGYLRGFDDPIFLKELPRFSLPKVGHGTYRAFEIMGDSMPPIYSGSIVIGQYVERIVNVKDNDRFIVVARDGIVFKRIVKHVKSLELISDNINYPPYLLLNEEVLEIWLFHSFIAFSNSMNDSQNKVETILEALGRIDSKIDFLVNH
jgi:transcriptional regulator with XRE-family HTH domain